LSEYNVHLGQHVKRILLFSINKRAVLYFLLSGTTKEAAEEAYIKKVEELKKA